MRGLLARYQAQEGQGDTVARALIQMAESVRRDEPDCLIYRASRSVEHPDVFVLYEEYTDEAALLAHRETAHFQELIEGVVVPVLVSRDREIVEPLLVDPSGGDR